jgi:DNA-binding CsgD family transcriptional regulator
MIESWQLALQLSGRLTAVCSFEDYSAAVTDFLRSVLPGDTPRWTTLKPVAGEASVARLSNGELVRGGGAHYTLSVVVAVDTQAHGHGWVIGRSGHDFSDEEIELVRSLLPVLALSWAHLRRSAPLSHRGVHPVLSPRERHALELLATGCTATAMARRMDVSPRTVRKHLGNLYRKMDVHDRLMAVERARSLGLLA